MPALLAAVASVLAPLTRPVLVVCGMPLSSGDLLGFVTGIVCVWLTARANMWNFPIGIANSAILGLVFFEQRLFADASLQIVFILLSVQGLLAWLKHGQTAESAPVLHSSRRELGLLAVSVVTVLPGLCWLLGRLNGSAPLVDALVASLSLAAQWLLNRRMLETWALWVIVDLISIPLYISRNLPLIAGLYLIFLGLCWQGFLRWRRLARDAQWGVP
jgi:nicotinamide mononucleotide transporter